MCPIDERESFGHFSNFPLKHAGPFWAVGPETEVQYTHGHLDTGVQGHLVNDVVIMHVDDTACDVQHDRLPPAQHCMVGIGTIILICP